MEDVLLEDAMQVVLAILNAKEEVGPFVFGAITMGVRAHVVVLVWILLLAHRLLIAVLV